MRIVLFSLRNCLESPLGFPSLSFPFPDRRSVPNEPRSREESITLTNGSVFVCVFSVGLVIEIK